MPKRKRDFQDDMDTADDEHIFCTPRGEKRQKPLKLTYSTEKSTIMGQISSGWFDTPTKEQLNEVNQFRDGSLFDCWFTPSPASRSKRRDSEDKKQCNSLNCQSRSGLQQSTCTLYYSNLESDSLLSDSSYCTHAGLFKQDIVSRQQSTTFKDEFPIVNVSDESALSPRVSFSRQRRITNVVATPLDSIRRRRTSSHMNENTPEFINRHIDSTESLDYGSVTIDHHSLSRTSNTNKENKDPNLDFLTDHTIPTSRRKSHTKVVSNSWNTISFRKASDNVHASSLEVSEANSQINQNEANPMHEMGSQMYTSEYIPI